MDILIQADLKRPVPRRHVTTRLRQALGRLPLEPVTAHVIFADVNGAKGGLDIRCAMQVEVPRRPPLYVERVGATPRLAFDACYERMVRQLERHRERWLDVRRYPKKYYVARRLL